MSMNAAAAAAAAARPNKSRDEQWMSSFLAVQSFYQKHQHLTIPNKTLSQWLTYQRLHAKTLNERQLTLLESIKYKDASVAGAREQDEEVWRTRYEELKQFASENGGIKGLPASLRSWVNRQKRKFQEHSLDTNKQQLLVATGVDLSGYKERNIGDSRKKHYDESWYQKYKKLEMYRKVHGHCNVPYRFADDPSLGSWVANQRNRYKRVKQRGDEEGDSRIKMLEEIGFEWTRKPKQSKLRNRSWNRRKHDREES